VISCELIVQLLVIVQNNTYAIYLREKECEDVWLFFEAKRIPQAKSLETFIVQKFRSIFGLHLPDKYVCYNLRNPKNRHYLRTYPKRFLVLIRNVKYFMIRTPTNFDMLLHLSAFSASRLFSVGDRWVSSCLNCILEFGLCKLTGENCGQNSCKVEGNGVMSALSACFSHTAR
jgi:hypothetical protein